MYLRFNIIIGELFFCSLLIFCIVSLRWCHLIYFVACISCNWPAFCQVIVFCCILRPSPPVGAWMLFCSVCRLSWEDQGIACVLFAIKTSLLTLEWTPAIILIKFLTFIHVIDNKVTVREGISQAIALLFLPFLRLYHQYTVACLYKVECLPLFWYNCP